MLRVTVTLWLAGDPNPARHRELAVIDSGNITPRDEMADYL
jgi:hypothetical protein